MAQTNVVEIYTVVVKKSKEPFTNTEANYCKRKLSILSDVKYSLFLNKIQVIFFRNQLYTRVNPNFVFL